MPAADVPCNFLLPRTHACSACRCQHVSSPCPCPPHPTSIPCCSIPHLRRDLILAATSGEELVEVMEDLGALRVVPLMQALLFDS
jgi:hypothetical protein